MRSRIFQLASTLICLASCTSAWACKPGPLYFYAPSAVVLAERLLTNSLAVVHARVLDAKTYNNNSFHWVEGWAKIEVLEKFNGPDNLTEIYTRVRFASCSNPEFRVGEQRLFVLAGRAGADGGVRYYELHSWLNKRDITQEQILSELRKANAKDGQPNHAVEK